MAGAVLKKQVRNGQDYKELLEMDDYLDNVRSDFENEWEDTPEFGTDETGLFVKKELLEE